MVLLNTNLFQIKIILILTLFAFSSQQQCILGQNCPIDQGVCVGDYCKCLNGFYSLLDPTLLPGQQIYCNYEQINVYKPLIMEIFLPSVGHFYAGKYILGTIKLILFILFCACSLILNGFIGVPKFIIDIMDKFGISLRNFVPDGLLGEKNEEENKEEKEGGDDENEDKDDEYKKKATLGMNIVPITKLLRAANNEDGKTRDGITQIKQAHNEDGEDIYDPKIEEPLIEKETNESQKEEDNNQEENNTILENIFKISMLFWVFYILDLFFYKLKIYNDGNDVPFIE